MPDRTDIVYKYDGSLEGLLTCVFEGFEKKESPIAILSPVAPQILLYPEKEILTDFEKSARVMTGIREKISQEAVYWVKMGMLIYHAEKELLIFNFLKLGFTKGAKVTLMLQNDRVRALHKAIGHLNMEAQKLKGFIRFSEYNKALVSIIEPKNIILPLLIEHFCGRYPQEQFMIFDKAHRMALIYRPYEHKIIPVEDLTLPEADENEWKYRKLWKCFYDTIAIEGRYNPKCRMKLMPKRYWKYMTEFSTETEKPEIVLKENNFFLSV